MSQNMVTLQAWRLENTDDGHFKQYTVLTDGQRYCIYGWSRIGSTWSWKPTQVGDVAGRARSQMQAKLGNGYRQVWAGDLTVPEDWCRDPRVHGRAFQDFIERTFRSNAVHAHVPGTAVSSTDTGTSALAGLLDECGSLVSKMAVDPDTALSEFPEIVGRYEQAREDMDTVESYLDTIRLMLAGQEAARSA